MHGDNLVGLDRRAAYSIIRSLANSDELTDSQAADQLHEWQADEAKDSTAVFPFQRGAHTCCPFSPSDVALALVSYRWERVAVALAYHGLLGTNVWFARSNQHDGGVK